MNPLEIWGGHECTVNRIGETWRDHTRLTGHEDRLDDLDLFAGLGLKALRYPVLWERTERARGHLDWAWPDERLARIRELGVRPIAGLVHHGSGPAWTDLLDADFAPLLAEFAGRAAARYPWVKEWTPVNEPVTTARFSALYGHWYPHRRDERDFWLALINQIDAVRLSMKAIRAVIPDARLIQTEDIGTTWATGPCRDQARFDNRRRLMSLDLLTGRVTSEHPLYARIAGLGLAKRLDQLAGDPTPPDVIGMNHYITSDRFLDHRLDRYPPETHGGNGAQVYADVEAVRVVGDRPCGWNNSLRQLWRRYRLPLAVTECHLGCSENEQQAWLIQAWNAVRSARRTGVDVRALTVWSLLGAVDWDSLLTREAGRYEPGVFDISDGQPRGRGVADLVSRLVEDAEDELDERPPLIGWWDRSERLLYPPFVRRSAMSDIRQT